MKRLLVAALLIGSQIIPAAAQQMVKLDEHVSVRLPAESQTAAAGTGNAWYSALTADKDVTKAMAMATLLPYSQMQLDSAEIAKNYNDAEFIEAMIKGMLGKLPGVELVSNKKITQSGRKGYEMQLVKKTPDDQFPFKKVYTRMLFGGDGIYMMTVYLAENITADKERDAFFSSIIFN